MDGRRTVRFAEPEDDSDIEYGGGGVSGGWKTVEAESMHAIQNACGAGIMCLVAAFVVYAIIVWIA